MEQGNDTPKLLDIETFLNNLLQRLFPVWYAQQAAREAQLLPLGVLNPNSFLSHRWMSLPAIVRALSESLAAHGNDWQALIELLEKLVTEKEYQRPLSISAIDGLEQSSHEQDWPNLLSWAEHAGKDIPHESADDFDAALHRAFPDSNKPHRVVYREWDGRYYWLNKEEPTDLAAALLFAHQKQRSASVNALINVETVNTKVLDRIRADYWLLLLQRESAYPVFDLIARAGLPATLAEFEWRRSDLVFLIARKNNRKLNQIILNLMNNRSTQQILEFGRYLSRQNFPFRNQ
ncbi:hypothetical protein ACQUQU_02185 [Thalassolituus sp. LLYu03]|uniref:hypothetical protein n=1 Tax=Thalassolituus sp. LLYu03 TaxID=3421656 RepID=UPI003D26785F